jgi:hypothetical protein
MLTQLILEAGNLHKSKHFTDEIMKEMYFSKPARLVLNLYGQFYCLKSA